MARYVYDLTEGRWISGKMPETRAAGDLRQLRARQHTLSVVQSAPSPHGQQPVPRCSATRLLAIRQEAIDFLTTVAGLLLFGCVALFFLLLA